MVVSLYPPIFAQDVPPAPAIDGVFDDWPDEYVVAENLQGDKKAVGIKKLSAVTSDGTVWLCFELDQAINLQGSNPDKPNILCRITGIDFDFKQKTASVEDSIISRRRLSWEEMEFQCMPTFASDRIEIRFSIKSIWPHPELPRQTIDDAGFVDGDVSFPIEIRERNFAEPKTDWDLDRTHDPDFRIANLNTLRNGLADPERGPRIKRLLDAAKASIVCFQKEWDEGKYRSALPQALGGEVNDVWSGGCAIATRLPLAPIPMTLDRAVAGLVTLPTGKHVAVISAHFKCCGYACSSEDDLRIQQAEQIIGEIKRMRDGAFGEKAQGAPSS
jgi:hypothetical protein